jgi:hypothetical protein
VTDHETSIGRPGGGRSPGALAGAARRRRTTLAALTISASLAGAALLSAPATAQDYDMDCKVILCLAGGFPTGCGDAYRYMIDRITARPPKPPFGYCAMSDGAEYTNHAVRYGRPGVTSPAGYYCPPDKRLHLAVGDDDGGGRGDIEAFCYTHATTRTVGRDGQVETTWHGRSSAVPINLEVQITLEPGTEAAFRSPLYAINYRTGFVAER